MGTSKLEKELERLSKIFWALSDARKFNLSGFPYVEMQEQFNHLLKEYLKEYFGDEIVFNREETFAYIQAHYKGVGIEINTFRGIILTIENQNQKALMDDFNEVFTGIVGMDPICSYHYCSVNCFTDEKTIYPTIEWSANPEARLFAIVNRFDCHPGDYIQDLEDYYTCSIIGFLNNQLLTVEGYKELFDARYDNQDFIKHKIKQIQKLNPNLDTSAISSWIDSSQKVLNLGKNDR